MIDPWLLILGVGALVVIWKRRKQDWRSVYGPSDAWARARKKSGLTWRNQAYFSDQELWESDGDIGKPYHEWEQGAKYGGWPEEVRHDYSQFVIPQQPYNHRKPRKGRKHKPPARPRRNEPC